MAQLKEDNTENEDINEDEQLQKQDERKKKKKAKWDIEEHIGSCPIKLKKRFDPNAGQDSLKDNGWVVRRGKVLGKKDGAIPKPNDCPETHLVNEYLSFLLTDPNHYNFESIRIKKNEELKITNSKIYVSKDYKKQKCLLMIIPGSGIVRAGEFATSVMKFDNIITGSALPFIEYAQDRKFSVCLFDPNGSSGHARNNQNHCIHVFDTFIAPYLCANANENENDSNSKENDEQKQNIEKNIESLLILAHSAGGIRTTKLLKQRGNIIQHHIKGIAFTDIKDPKQQVLKYEVSKEDGCKEQAAIIKEIYNQCAINWVKTKTGKALDEKMKKGAKTALVKRLSSGHSDHKYTTPSAYPSIIKFFDEKMKIVN